MSRFSNTYFLFYFLLKVQSNRGEKFLYTNAFFCVILLFEASRQVGSGRNHNFIDLRAFLHYIRRYGANMDAYGCLLFVVFLTFFERRIDFTWHKN